MTDEERKRLVEHLRAGRPNQFERKSAEEIEQLADERDQLVEQLAIRSETGMAKDMQEIMRINNELSERLAALTQSDPLPREHQDPSKWVSRETVERAHALAQSDAEPVAWRVKDYGDAWTLCYTREEAFAEAKNDNRIEPLYTAPLRPDASAGLIEAAVIDDILTTLKHARVFITSREKMHPTGVELYDELVEFLRARAANRSHDASAGLIEAAAFTNRLLTLSFDRCEIDTCEIMELGEKLGLLEQAAYDPNIHKGVSNTDEGETIFVLSAKGKSVRAFAADRSMK